MIRYFLISAAILFSLAAVLQALAFDVQYDGLPTNTALLVTAVLSITVLVHLRASYRWHVAHRAARKATP